MTTINVIKTLREKVRTVNALHSIQDKPELLIDLERQLEDEVVEELLNILKPVKVVRNRGSIFIEFEKALCSVANYDYSGYAIEFCFSDDKETEELLNIVMSNAVINFKFTNKIVDSSIIETVEPELKEKFVKDRYEEAKRLEAEGWVEVNSYIHESDYPCGVFLRNVEPIYGKVILLSSSRQFGPTVCTLYTIFARQNTLLKVIERISECGPNGYYYDRERIIFVGKKPKTVKVRVISDC